ncbi:selenocysteine-specific translation elongation factor [Pasteurella testudinis]|uniref:selenocysteine-specific translation elongation factor n=1 Tax=Pasteurella testudinis TaxID=761 RepID=UPI004057D6DB
MIIVSAGHVDHGKTALIQALTGTDTTHLPEEKKRGMTIDLGYAYLPLADGRTLGFIDVPGHERFLSNMLAGLGGVEYAMLVVAADEGIKPQTDEHLTLLKLLDFKRIMLVISKADKADAAQIAQLQQTLFQRYPFLADQGGGKSAVFVTSAVSGQGIAALKNHLAALDTKPMADKPFRYAIDRTFHIKGAGKVVTGTAFGGQVAIDDKLFLSRQLKQEIRVKNIHAQNQQAARGSAGQRLALNLASAEQSVIERGDWLFSHDHAYGSERITVLVKPNTVLKTSQAIHLYHAASHITAKLTLLQTPQSQSAVCLAEVILQYPLFLAFGDKLILRSGDNKQTLAGATVLEINSPTRYKRNQARLDYLWQLANSDSSEQRLGYYLAQGCLVQSAVCWTEQLSEPHFRQLQQRLGFSTFHHYVFSQDYRQRQQQRLLQAMQLYHQQHSDQLGVSKARLQRMACLKQPVGLIYQLIDELLNGAQLAQTRGWIHLPDHKIELSAEEQQLWQRVEAEFLAAQGQALWVRDLAKALAIEESVMRNFLYKAGKLGYLTAVIKDRFFLSETVYAYADRIKQHIARHGGISVNELRDQLQFGRKMTVQLIEYFDKCGFLWRKGDVHLLRDGDIFENA